MTNKFIVVDLDHMETFTKGDGPIIVVDDDPAQITIVETCYKKAGRANELICVPGGEDFLTLIEEVKRNQKPMPELVLLDINMPRKNGFDVLEIVRNSKELKEVPVIMMFTSSDSEVDKEKARALQANAFMSKPVGVKDYIRFFKSV